jgi:hypothetical protein
MERILGLLGMVLLVGTLRFGDTILRALASQFDTAGRIAVRAVRDEPPERALIAFAKDAWQPAGDLAVAIKDEAVTFYEGHADKVRETGSTQRDDAAPVLSLTEYLRRDAEVLRGLGWNGHDACTCPMGEAYIACPKCHETTCAYSISVRTKRAR